MKTSSVVIASYNGEAFIIEQLDSIRIQTKSPDEVIICDDNSNDNTAKIVEDYIKQYNLMSWSLIVNRSNVGWKANFAKLVSLATKDIIFFCDQDDIWRRDKIEVMVNAMQNIDNIKLLVSNLKVVYMSDNSQKYNPEPLGKGVYGKVKTKSKWSRIMRPGCVFAVDRDFAQECFKNNWSEELAHDLLLWQYAYCRDKIGYVNEELIQYRRFESSATFNAIKSNIIKYKSEFRVFENQIFLESFVSALIGLENIPSYAMRSFKLEKLRREFFVKKNVVTWLKCAMYLDCFPKKRTWLADLWYGRINGKDSKYN